MFLLSVSIVFAAWVEFDSAEYTEHKQPVSMHGVTIDEYQSYMDYKATIHLDKGWNLIAGGSEFLDEYLMPGSELSLDDLTVVYAFFPASKQYLQIYPEPSHDVIDAIAVKIKPEEKEELKTVAKWVYAKNAGILKMDFYIYYDVFALWKGWNLIAINPFLEGKTLNGFKGNCNIVKAYEFKDNNWVVWNLDKRINKQDLGKGIAIKSSNDCVLYEQNENNS